MATVRNSEVRHIEAISCAVPKSRVNLEKKKIMHFPNDNCSGQSETVTSLHEFYNYRLKHL